MFVSLFSCCLSKLIFCVCQGKALRLPRIYNIRAVQLRQFSLNILVSFNHEFYKCWLWTVDCGRGAAVPPSQHLLSAVVPARVLSRSLCLGRGLGEDESRKTILSTNYWQVFKYSLINSALYQDSHCLITNNTWLVGIRVKVIGWHDKRERAVSVYLPFG